MKLREKNDMQLKKQALRSKIREEWKQSYFQSVRKSILCHEQRTSEYQ